MTSDEIKKLDSYKKWGVMILRDLHIIEANKNRLQHNYIASISLSISLISLA